MSSKMIKAAVAVDIKRTEVREFARPPSDEGGLLKIEVTGVCGADWPFYQSAPKTKGPLILGHESVGVVEELGPGVRWGVKEGDRVALEEYLPCGRCAYCYSGDFRLCDQTDLKIGGLRYGLTSVSKEPALWGGFSEYQYLHPNTVFHKVPAHVPAEQAALALPLGNGVEWAYLQGRAGIGQTVVIQGPGQQGLACVVAAKEAGAACIIVTGLGNPTDRFRLELAKQLGATHTVNIDEQDLLETVGEITNGTLADLVIDCASGGPSSVSSAIQLTRKRGRVILSGQKYRRIPEFDSDLMISRFINVKGMRGHSFEAVELAMQIIASGSYPLKAMSTHQFGLHEVDEALRTVGGEGQPNPIHCTVNPWKT
ncbi:MAG: alcohol dehydrogenase [Noviherbaspirillum sp.]|nr:alcohol dehydrogenase [Noviherbaspirillum sp.]